MQVEGPHEADAQLANKDPASPSGKTPVKRGRFATNIVSSLGFFIFNMALGIWFTPYLIHHLGTASYGIIPLAVTITGYMAVLTLALNSAVARFMTIALERGEKDTANRYFNTSLFGSILLVLALLIPVTWAALHAEMFIVVPAGQVVQARWLFGCAAAAFLLNTVKTPFEVSTYCLNRFDLRNLLAVAQKLTYVGAVVALFSFTTPQMWKVGFAMLTGTCAAWLGAVCLWRILTPELSVSISYFSRSALKGLTSIGGWVSFNAIGAIMFLGVELLIVNRMFGPESGGRYAAVMQWSLLLRTIAGTVAGVFGPTILYYYARNDIDGLVVYARRAMKCLGLLLALPIGLICGLSAPLLETWLGPDFVDLAWLMSLMTVHLCVNLAVLPLFPVQTATKHVRWPAIVTFVMGVGNVGLAVLLAGPVGWGMYGVAAAGAIALTAKNVVFTPLYTAQTVRQKWSTFLSEMWPIVGAVLVTILGCRLLMATCDLATWPRLIATGATLSVVYVAVSYFFVLNEKERAALRDMIQRKGVHAVD